MTERDLAELQREIAQHEKDIQGVVMALDTAQQAAAVRIKGLEERIAEKRQTLARVAPHLFQPKQSALPVADIGGGERRGPGRPKGKGH